MSTWFCIFALKRSRVTQISLITFCHPPFRKHLSLVSKLRTFSGTLESNLSTSQLHTQDYQLCPCWSIMGNALGCNMSNKCHNNDAYVLLVCVSQQPTVWRRRNPCKKELLKYKDYLQLYNSYWMGMSYFNIFSLFSSCVAHESAGPIGVKILSLSLFRLGMMT